MFTIPLSGALNPNPAFSGYPVQVYGPEPLEVAMRDALSASFGNAQARTHFGANETGDNRQLYDIYSPQITGLRPVLPQTLK